MAENKNKNVGVETLDISKSNETLHLALDLAKFIKENKLYQNIQGKEYVNVEGWQYAGNRLGITPIIENVINVSTDTELKYSSFARLYDIQKDKIVGAGFAVCSNKEQGKKFYQEFAISSMAQTRAIGKAYRNILAWIIRAAGYEPTPAEEMDYSGNTPEPKVEQPKPEVPKATPAQQAAPAEPVQAVKYASESQKAEIIRLLNNPCISRQEKTKMLLNVNKLDSERAEQAITKLNNVIREREAESAAADEDPAITEAQREELRKLAAGAGYSRQVLDANYAEIKKVKTVSQYLAMKDTYLAAA